MTYAHYIAGEWVTDDAVSININPSNTTDIVGEFSRGDAALVDESVAAANAAQPAWASASPQLRHDVLEKASNLITSRKKAMCYTRILPVINHENRQCGFRAAKTAMVEGKIIKSDFCRHPIAPLHLDTKASLLELLTPLDPVVLRWGH